ncbi:LuxR C-terminal-related transcriptional regulator [Streptomyces sp. NPDC056479]|uniref:LuxR C-terminal-related transcriptional regulator n=1 Tax=unclassified Streptomyces TaxID=2593676 RepID=UPI00369A4287
MIADDSALVRRGTTGLLTDAGCRVLAAVDHAEALLLEMEEEVPDAIIVDIRMPPTFSDEGITLAQEAHTRHPELGVLVLSQYLETHYALRLISEVPEHVGYLLKERVADAAVLTDALRRVVDGDCVVDPTIVTRLMRRSRTREPMESLTARELEVLALMAEGRSNSAIAQRLFMSPKTLESHIRQLMRKLDLHESAADHRRVLAVLTYMRARNGAGSAGG